MARMSSKILDITPTSHLQRVGNELFLGNEAKGLQQKEEVQLRSGAHRKRFVDAKELASPF